MSHVLHLLLTVFTAGLWAPVWLLIGVNASSADKHERQRYAEQMAMYRQAYDDWQRRYHQVYGVAPNPMPY